MANSNPLQRAFYISLGILVALLTAGLVFLPNAQSTGSAAADDGPVALVNATVFDGEAWHDEVTVLLSAGRVTGMGADVALPDDVRTIDVAGQTVLPGLIDAHTHTVGDALRQSLRFGVTTNLDMFAPSALLASTRMQRDATDETSRADLFSAGVLATVEGGHGTQYGVPVDVMTGPDDATAWVARRIGEGSDYIKLVYMPYQQRIPSLDLDTATALINAAHEAGVMAVAHISSGRGASDMVDAGVDGLVHIWAETPVTDDFIARARAANLFVIPTLAVYASTDHSGEGGRLAEDPNISPWLSEAQRAGLGADFGARIPTMRLAGAVDNARRLHAAGIALLAGSDAPNPGTTHGASLHHELELLSRAGLTPTEALHAATGLPAERFDIGTRGRLAVGARADLIVVNGDPRDDIVATRDIAHVFKNGIAVDRALDEAARKTDGEALTAGAIGTFEDGIGAPDGYVWSATDDGSFGGDSVSTLTHVPPGDDAPAGALRVAYSVRPGFSFPWSGLYFGAGDEQPRSLRNVDTLELSLRGTPGRYRVMFFNAGSVGAPPTVSLDITESWNDYRIRLDDVASLNRGQVAGIAVVAGPSPGDGYLELARAALR